MPTQMTREEYEQKYGTMPNVLSSTAREMASQPQPGVAESFGNRIAGDVGGKIGGFVDKASGAVTDFIGARPIADTYGTEIAVQQNPQQEGALRANAPTLKETVGGAIETASMLIPGAGAGTSLARKAGLGAVTGYGVDVGSALQTDAPISEAVKPGVATSLGAVLPFISKIVGSAPKALEEANLRMTPVEQQNLLKRGKDIAGYLAEKKVVGTPTQRLSQVSKLYDEMEERVTKTIAKTGIAIPKTEIEDKVRAVVRDYADDPIALPEVERAVDDFLRFLDKKDTYAVSVSDINNFKRTIMERAFSKNKADVVSEGRYAVGTALKNLLNEEVSGLQKLNDEYSDIITARRVLAKASTRNQANLLTRTLATGIGATAGGTLGGFFGATVGGVGAERLTNALATPVRSATGATIQTLGEVLSKVPIDEQGNVSAKLLMQALTGEEE